MARNNNKSNKSRNCKPKNQNSKPGNRNNRRGSSEFDKEEITYKDKQGTNDVDWYAQDPNLLRDSASIPFSWAAGTKIDFGSVVNNDYYTPGLMTIDLIPSIGYCDSANSAVNIAAAADYTFVRHQNSGHANYDAPDLMLYNLAMASIYSYINFLQRAYGCMTLYSQRNRYMPKTLIQSMRINFDDVFGNLASFRYGINLLINKAASMAVAADKTLFKRHAFLYQNIYTEGTSVKDQLYMYNPQGFWMFVETEGAGQLKMIQFTPTSLPEGTGSSFTMKQLLDFGNMLLDPIIESEDMNIMSGDVLKAYGQNILKLAPLPEYYPVIPVFNIGVLEQMKNAFIPEAFQLESAAVVQDPTHGFLLSKPQAFARVGGTTEQNLNYNRLAQMMRMNKLLTTTTADPGPEIVMESTRLMGTCNSGLATQSGGTRVQGNWYCGSEIPTLCNFYHFSASGSPTRTQMTSLRLGPDYGTAELSYLVDTVKSTFDFAPLQYVFDSFASNNNGVIAGIMGDVDNYAVLSPQDLEKLHEAAIMNELHVPSIARL